MTDNTAATLMLAAFFALCGFVCWLHARYPRSSGERESSIYKWTITQAQPGRIAPNGNIECAPTRKPKPVPPIRPTQPNRRKEEKGKEVKAMSAWIAGAIGAVSGSVLTAILLCLCRDVHPEEQKGKSERDTRTDLTLLQLHKRICRLERYNCGECAELNSPSPDESFNQFKARYDEAYKRDVKANKWGRDGDRWEGLSPEVRLFAPAALPPGVWKNRFDRSAWKWNEELED